MKRLYILSLVSTLLLTSCVESNDFPLPNRCGYPDVIVNSISKNIYINPIISSGNISHSIKDDKGNQLWLMNNVTINGKVVANCLDLRYNNSNESLKLIFKGTEENPFAFIDSSDQQYFFTLNDGIYLNGKYEIITSLYERTGDGVFDFRHLEDRVYSYEVENNKIEFIGILNNDPDIMFGAAIFETDDYTYIYGTKNVVWDRECYVCRIPKGDLNNPMKEYYSDRMWVSDRKLAKPIMKNVSEYFSVFEYEDKIYLITQGAILGKEVNSYTSDNPAKGWDFDKILYCRSNTSEKDKFAINIVVHDIEEGKLICSQSFINPDFISYINEQSVLLEIGNWKRTWF